MLTQLINKKHRRILRYYFELIYFSIFRVKVEPMVVSFYADFMPDKPYEKAAHKLIKKLKFWGIKHQVVKLSDNGGYRLNTLTKPRFLFEMLTKTGGPIVWIDCDSDLRNPKALIDCQNYDIAIISKSDGWDKMLVGMISFNYTSGAYKVLREWVLHCNLASKIAIRELDHEALMYGVIPTLQSNIKIKYVNLNEKLIQFKASQSSQSIVAQSESQKLNMDLRKSILQNAKEEIVIVENLFQLENVVKHVQKSDFLKRSIFKIKKEIMNNSANKTIVEQLYIHSGGSLFEIENNE